MFYHKAKGTTCEVKVAFNFKHQIALLPIGTTLVILVTIIIFLVKGKKSLLLLSFIAMLAMMFLWAFGQILQYLSGNQLTTILAHRVIYTSICFMSLSWLLFALVYTNNPIISNINKLVLFAIPPVFAWCGLLTDNLHHLFFTVLKYDSHKYINSVVIYGIIFWLTTIYSYGYIIAGSVILIKFMRTQATQARRQTRILLFAPIISFIASFSGDLYLLITKDPSPKIYDPTPICFSVTILFFGIAAFRYHFLEILPGALRKVVENIDDAVLIIDNNNCIVSYNPAFAGFFQQIYPIQPNHSISTFTQALRQYCEIDPKTALETALIFAALESNTSDLAGGDICLRQPERKYFKIKTRLIINQKRVQGRIVTFSDVTGYRQLLAEVNQKNAELSTVNEQLKEHLTLIEELAIVKERNRIARDTHDTLGHTMTLLIALLEVSTILCEQNPAETKAKLLEATLVAKQGIKELRRSIHQKMEISNLFDSLQKLFVDLEVSGMKVDFSVEGVANYLNPKYEDLIYRICQEALTNALRHGKARRTAIILRFDNQAIRLYIFDDGQGCQKISKGMGLTGMEQRVKECNGNIEYGSNGEIGFNINVEIPFALNRDVSP